MPTPLPIPPAANRDENSVEMIRVWIAEQKQQCVLNIGFWEDRFDERQAWGILLADMICHIANAHEEEYGRDTVESIEIIRKSFEQELQNKTSDHPGEFL